MRVTVTGPLVGGAHGIAFAFGVEERPGHVVEEFLVEGEAVAYTLAAGAEYDLDGRWDATPTRTAPFRTRIVVQRPQDPLRFGGTVVVDWLNVTGGFELASPPADLAQFGAAWVGVSAQRVGVEGFAIAPQFGLRGWDVERYGTLQHPGDDFSFDIFTQAARVVGPGRAGVLGEAPDPMAGLVVSKVVAMGTSQSALRLRAYVDAVQPLAHCFDGFLLSLDMGAGACLDTTQLDVSIPNRIPHVPARVRDDLDVPVMVVNSETEVPRLAPARQPDTDRFRLWEIAGAAHIGGPVPRAEAMAAALDRFAIPADALPARPADANVLSHQPVQRAAFRHFVRWVEDGTAPPSFPLVEVAGDPAAVVRDDDGNACGGIRLPDVVVPLAAHAGVRDDPDDDMLRRISGSSRPLPEETLRARYRTVDAYLRAYRQALDEGIAAGYLVAEDAPVLLETATVAAQKAVTW